MDCIPEANNTIVTAAIASVVCSLIVLCVGVLLGAVGLYLIQRVKGRLCCSSSSPSLAPPPTQQVVYEDLDAVRHVETFQKIQLTFNEAYSRLARNATVEGNT